MKERPIIFSAPMVLALLAGTKSQTRRVVKPQPPTGVSYSVCAPADRDDYRIYPGRWAFGGNCGAGWMELPLRCPYGVPGDRLWVRETIDIDPHGDIFYRADNTCVDGEDNDDSRWGKYRAGQTITSMFMPRHASRITIEVTGVRVERLQGISEADAVAEGVDAISLADVPRHATRNRRSDYAQLWDKINAKRVPWASNPWVWVLEFRPL